MVIFTYLKLALEATLKINEIRYFQFCTVFDLPYTLYTLAEKLQNLAHFKKGK